MQIKYYVDRWGDKWVRKGDYVIRLKDNNIGLWQNGHGLSQWVGKA